MPDFDEAHDALVEHRNSKSSITPVEGTTTALTIVDLIESVNNDGRYYLSTLPDESFQQRLEISRYVSSKENDIEILLQPNFIEAVHFILTKAQFTDKDGKEVVSPKLTLIDVKGKAYCVLARIFVTEFLQVVQALGVPPWPEPVKISCKMEKGNGANRYYSLVLP